MLKMWAGIRIKMTELTGWPLAFTIVGCMWAVVGIFWAISR